MSKARSINLAQKFIVRPEPGEGQGFDQLSPNGMRISKGQINNTQSERGLTLIELLIFIVIVGIAATAILGVFGSLTRNSASMLPDKQAQAIAAGMMQEVLARSAYCGSSTPTADPSNPGGPDGIETRTTPFNNVNDYNAFDSNPAGISFLDGVPLANLPGYRVQVAVDGVTPVAGVAGGNALHVIVSVTHPTGAGARLDGVRFCYASTP